MRLRRLLAAAGVGLGGAAILNRALASRAGEPSPPPVGTRRTYRWRGMDVGYVEAGDPDAPDLLAAHGLGLAASGREFHDLLPALSDEYHVVVPDLPGFGASERPPLSYTPSFYRTFLAEVAGALTADATCVASGLTGAFAATAAEEAGFDRLVLVCPTAETASRRPLLRGLVRTPLVGTALFNGLVSRPALRWTAARRDFYGPEAVTSDLVADRWHSAHQPGARLAPASLLGGTLDPDVDLGATLAPLPVTLVWGREATRPPLSEGRSLAERADAGLVVFDRARRLPHAEHPEQFVETLRKPVARVTET